jgi:hypothetical protein
MSAISISASKDDQSRFDVVEQRADADRSEDEFERQRKFVWSHHFILAKPTRNLAATITPTTHTIAHVARSRMSASRLRDALNADQDAALKILYRVRAKRVIDRRDVFAPNLKALGDAVNSRQFGEHIHDQKRLIYDSGLCRCGSYFAHFRPISQDRIDAFQRGSRQHDQ